MTAPVRTVFLGSGTFALPALERLIASERTSLVAAVTAPPRPFGRRGDVRPTPVGARAREAGIDVLTPARLRDDDVIGSLRALEPQLIVLADYGRLVPQRVLDLPAHGALNLHPSLLPRHRGASPVPAAILAGDVETGVTLMRMDAGLDTGPIVAQARWPLRGDERAPQLEADLATLGAELLDAHLPGWLSGTLEATPQPEDGATLTRPLRRRDGLLDPTRPASELARQVRAYEPWPGTYLETPDGRLIIWRAEAVDGEVTSAARERGMEDAAAAAGRPGELEPDGDGIALRTAAGRLRLLEVQPAGRRRMSGAELRRGMRGGASSRRSSADP